MLETPILEIKQNRQSNSLSVLVSLYLLCLRERTVAWRKPLFPHILVELIGLAFHPLLTKQL